ncbi:MAG TPA: ABC transporter ATP-binding protein [Candidatus Lokiarchaeia archaeon]|nr:ABC transporter ATP-binding protein [Candidatus Lokiarchaeia archaeon]
MAESRNETEIGDIPVPLDEDLVIENLVKVYKTGTLEVLALRGLSLKIPPGKIVVIMGPSGCGKTTLLNLIGGLDIPTSGLIRLGTEEITKKTPHELEDFRRKNVGFIFQFMNLVPILNAEENIALPMKIAGRSRKDIDARVTQLLELVNLQKRKDHRPEEMSGGEQQRVAVAAALANDPPLLLCDEPTGELDTENKREVMKILRTLITENCNKIILIVTHDPEVQEIADIVLHIRDGLIVEQLEGEELATSIESTQGPSTQSQKNTAQLRELKKMMGEISKRLDNLEPEA